MSEREPGQQVPYLSIQGLTKRFGSLVALSGIDLDVYEGEFVCFLGPSGCGKTTLLRAIAGLTPQSEGRIVQAGRDISQLPVTQRDFGIVFQSYALFPNLTVAGNVGYGLWTEKTLDRAARAARVRDLLALVGLEDLGAKYPAQLSGGQQQRVALARALATSPGLLLLDEPLSALDARVRLRLRNEIKQLQRRVGVTTIMVTHDQDEALTMADRIVVMNDGRIEQVGTPLEIYDHPATEFVADFVGAMNLIPAEAAGGATLTAGGVTLACAAQTAAALAPGARVTLCLRPEDVLLPPEGQEAENSFTGRVVALEFAGSLYRAQLELDAGSALQVTATLPVGLVRGQALDTGSAIRIALPRDRLRIFPSQPGRGARA